jgi:hypothetical protein
MNPIAASGLRQTANPALPVNADSAAAPVAKAAAVPAAEPTDLVSISHQALAQAANLGKDTVKAAQDFLERFARQLFGDKGKISFDSASIDVETSAGAATVAAEGAYAHALSLDESAHFIGRGQIVTDDGTAYDFEIEVLYESHTEASVAATQLPLPPELLALSGRALPQIEFPGGVADLFNLLGRDLQYSVNGNGEGAGNLSMRLLRLVNTAALIAPRAPVHEAHGKAYDAPPPQTAELGLA